MQVSPCCQKQSCGQLMLLKFECKDCLDYMLSSICMFPVCIPSVHCEFVIVLPGL